jgi:head-tail adaptor
MAGAGYFRQVLTVQNPVTTVDAYGQGSEAWVTVCIIRGRLYDPSGYQSEVNSSEVLDDGGPAMQQEFSIEATWHPGISMRSRIKWNDNGVERTLNLRSCHDPDARRKRLRMRAIEVLP